MDNYQLTRELVRRKLLIESGMKGNPSLAYARVWVVKERGAEGKWKVVRYFESEDEARSFVSGESGGGGKTDGGGGGERGAGEES